MAIQQAVCSLIMRVDRLREIDPELLNSIIESEKEWRRDDYDGKLCRCGFMYAPDGKRLLDKLHTKGLREPDIDSKGFIKQYNDYIVWPDPFNELYRPTTDEEFKDYIYPTPQEQFSSVCDWAVFDGHWFGHRKPSENIEPALKRLAAEAKALGY
jgi:hypothetical protein